MWKSTITDKDVFFSFSFCIRKSCSPILFIEHFVKCVVVWCKFWWIFIRHHQWHENPKRTFSQSLMADQQQATNEQLELLRMLQLLQQQNGTTSATQQQQEEVLDANLISMIMSSDSGRHGPPPASLTSIQELDEILVDKAFLSRNDNATLECVVCSENFHIEEYVKKMPCKHWFHSSCLEQWLVRTNTCPLCRTELPTLDAHYEAKKREQNLKKRLEEGWHAPEGMYMWFLLDSRSQNFCNGNQFQCNHNE